MSARDEGQQISDQAFERFTARVATLTPAECSALVAAHRPLDSEAARRWGADQAFVLTYGLSGFDRLARAYSAADPFKGKPVADVIVYIGLALIDRPPDPSISEASLRAWGEVIGWSGIIGPTQQIEAWPDIDAEGRSATARTGSSAPETTPGSDW